ncbi:MAG: transposase [Candidatus Amoebophilus sp.]
MHIQAIALLIHKVLKQLVQLKAAALMVGKKIKGRKRHIVTDTQGHLLAITVHAANIHDTVVGCEVFRKSTPPSRVFALMLVIERP